MKYIYIVLVQFNLCTLCWAVLQIKKAVRATLILFPLLGITNLLFFINPKNGTHDKIYMLFNASMQSSQVHKVLQRVP